MNHCNFINTFSGIERAISELQTFRYLNKAPRLRGAIRVRPYIYYVYIESE